MAPDSAPTESTARTWPRLPYVWLAVLGSIALLALARFTYHVRPVLVIVMFSVLLSLVLVYPVNFMARAMPRAIAAGATAGIVVALSVLLLWALAPFFVDQLDWFIDNAPQALARAGALLRALVPSGVKFAQTWSQPISRDEIAQLISNALPVAMGVFEAGLSLLAVLALATFLAYDGNNAERGLLRLVSKDREEVVGSYLRRIGTVLQRWIVGQLASMTATGLLIGLGLFLLGLNSWLVLAVLSFLLEFVPYLGPVLSAVPGILTGLAVSPEMALWVAVVYAAVHFVESYLLQPLIMKRAIRIPPALQLVWQLAMATAFGVLGIFVATPLLACVQVTVEFFYVERHLGRARQGA